MLQSYKELKVWQKSFDLCKHIDDLSRSFPPDERFGLVAQVRRAAVSISSNIAEGYSRDATRDYLRFLWMARGSLAEIETQLMLARDLGFAKPEQSERTIVQLNEVGRMLRGLIRSLEESRSVAVVPAAASARSSIVDPRS